MLLEEYEMSEAAAGPLSARLEMLAAKSPLEIAASSRETVKQLAKKVVALANVVDKK
jgi:hypothetical protein